MPDLERARQAGGLRRVAALPRRSRQRRLRRAAPEPACPTARPVYFLCRSGVRSIAAAEAATAAGLGPAYNVARGLRGTARRATATGPSRLEERRPALAAGMSEPTPRTWAATAFRPDTLAVRGGLARSDFDETSEALYLTSGFVYESAEQAEAAFKGEVDHFIYCRYGNPTVTTFEERLRLLEGAQACFATASGMSAVFAALAALLGKGDRVVSVARAVRVVLRDPRRDPAPLGRRDRVRRRPRPRPVARGAVGADPGGVLRDAEQPDAGARRHRGGQRPGPRRRRAGGRRQRLRHAGLLQAARARRRRRRLLGDQAHRRPGPRPRRRGARHDEFIDGPVQEPDAAHRPVDVAVQRLGAGQGPGDAVAAGREAGRATRWPWPSALEAAPARHRGASTRSCRPTRSTSSPSARCWAAARS